MRSVIRVGLTCFVLATTLTACSTSTTKAEFKTTVELKKASPDCDVDPRCWLPTQFQPSLVKGESVSLFNEWPAKGDQVKVICETTGEKLVDYTGRGSRKWYGILIPTDKVSATNTKAHPVKGGYLGYVSALWLANKQSSAPAC
jgi:hypothetical protein